MPKAPGIVVGILLVAALAGCADAPASVASSSHAVALADRTAVPEVSGTLLDGSDFALSSLDGQVVVINVWGSWCSPCRAESPELQQVYEATAPLGVAFLGVNVRDQRPLASAFVRSKGIDYPSLFDPTGSITLALRVVPPSATPATVVLDRSHRAAAVWPGPVTAAVLEPVVRAVAAEPAR